MVSWPDGILRDHIAHSIANYYSQLFFIFKIDSVGIVIRSRGWMILNHRIYRIIRRVLEETTENIVVYKNSSRFRKAIYFGRSENLSAGNRFSRPSSTLRSSNPCFVVFKEL